MAQTMLWGMLLMALAFWMYSIAVALMRVRAIILERERHTEWVKHADGIASASFSPWAATPLRLGQLRRLPAADGCGTIAGPAPS
jgi:hypothetical protein